MEYKFNLCFKILIQFLLVQLLYISPLKSQANGEYRSRQDGNWSSAVTWEVYNNGNWAVALSPPSQLDGPIECRHNIQITADQVMDQVVLDTNAELLISPGVMVTVTNSIDTVEMHVKGVLINTGMLFFSPSAHMFVDSAGTYIHNSSIASSSVLDATFLDAQSTWIYRGNGTLAPPVAFSNRHYGHLIFESTAGNWNRTLSGSIPTSCTNLKIGANVMLVNNYAGTLSIHGDLIIDGSLVNGSGSQKFLLDGHENYIGGSNPVSFYDQLSIPEFVSYTLLNNIRASPASNFSVLGTLDCQSYLLDGNNGGGTFSLAAGAWLETSHAGGVPACIKGFANYLFDDAANYEFSGNVNHDVLLYNPTVHHLRIHAAASAQLTLRNSAISIHGILSLVEGQFSIDTNTINLYGSAVEQGAGNLIGTSQSTLNFYGGDSGIFIPASITLLKNLTIDKSAYSVSIMQDLHLANQLSLQKGNLITGTHSVYVEGSLTGGISGGRDSSYVEGNLCRRIPAGDSLRVFFPVGKSRYQPVVLSQLSSLANTAMSVCAFENSPMGSADETSLQGNMMDRYWNIKVVGNSSIMNLGIISLCPRAPAPALQDSSRIGFSRDNSSLSYHSIGGIIDSASIRSTKSLSACQIDDLSSYDGGFLGIARQGTEDSILSVDACTKQLELKFFIQGFYLGDGRMQAVIDPFLHPALCDSVLIEIHSADSTLALEYSSLCTFDTAGSVQLSLPPLSGVSHYVVIRHRNSLETWSSLPINFNDPKIYYDYTDAQNKAFGNNLYNLNDGHYAIYSGDLALTNPSDLNSKDGQIDLQDLQKMEADILSFGSGYLISDLTGDGIIDLSDYSLLENNLEALVQLIRP